MISSQYGTVFVKSDYGKIKKVYSIWICTNPSQEMEYTITRYKMTEENIEGKVNAKKANYDLLDVVMVCLGPKKYSELTGLLGMLNLVFKDNDLTAAEKREKLANEFHIEITPELEKGVADMCNLSAGIERRGIEKGRVEGENRLARLISHLLSIGKSDEIKAATESEKLRNELYKKYGIA